MGMILSHSTRKQVGTVQSCHDQCDPNLAPRQVKKTRRHIKRAEARIAKKDIREQRDDR